MPQMIAHTGRRTAAAGWRSLAVLLGLLLPAAARGALDHVTLKLKWQHQFQFAGYYAALEKGFYGDAGLDVTIEPALPGEDPVPAVLDGHAQYGVGVSDLLLERAKGAPVVVLANIFQHSPLILITRAGRGTSQLHALLDGPIMLEPHDAELLAYFRNEGIDTSRLTIVPHTFSPEQFMRGEVAAMSGYRTDEPWWLDQHGVPYEFISPRSGGIDFYGDNLYTTESEIARHPARVKAFRAASLRGWDYAMAHQEEIVDLILAKYAPNKSRDHLLFEARQSAELIYPGLIEMGHINPGRWRHIADTYAELGMLPKDFDLNGFLHDPNPAPDYRWLEWAFGITAALAVGLLGWVAPLVRLNRALRQREREFRGLIEDAPFPVLIVDLETGEKLFANHLGVELIARLYGLDMKAGQAIRVLPGTEEECRQLRERVQAGESIRGHEMKVADVKGRVVYLHLNLGAATFAGRGCAVVAINDLTHRHEIEEDLRRAKETAEAAQAARSQALAMMSHEIRSPLSGMLSLAESLLREEMTSSQREAVATLHQAGHELLKLINNVLDLSRLESGRVELDLQPCALGDLVHQMQVLFQPVAESQRNFLLCAAPREGPQAVVLDVLRFRQVLANLLANALKFTQDGVVELGMQWVDYTPGAASARLRATVRDTGVGIGAEQLPRLFEPYAQGDRSVARRFGGTGLGLTISRRLARLMGGDLTVQSEPARGSTFAIEVQVNIA